MLNVLISSPNMIDPVFFLPTIWGNLRAFCDQVEHLATHLNWLDPVLFKGEPERILESYHGTPIHVLGLSCYAWNLQPNLDLARYVKRRYPDCLVVAGGPDPEYKNPRFFSDHPYIDCVVPQEGELPFRTIMEQLCAGRLALDSIPGVATPRRTNSLESRDAHSYHLQPGKFITEFDYQPWLRYADYYSRIIEEVRSSGYVDIAMCWETDRGCPYKCSFCDWGSATHTKLRTIDMDRLRREADWIGRNKIDTLFMTAANLGILKRDIEIFDYVVQAKKKYGYPQRVIWNTAKNNPDRVTTLHEMAFDVGLLDVHVLSIQSIDDDVLGAMERKNLKKHKQLQVVESLQEISLPTVVQVIYGCPEQTPDKFKTTLTTLMERGIHDEYIAYPFTLLPNSPANAPEYRERWGIGTMTRQGRVDRRRRDDPVGSGADWTHFIVSTNSFDRDDYVDMNLYARLIIALHNSGLTRFLSIYLRHTHDVSYRQFYDLLLDKLFSDPDTLCGSVYQRCHQHFGRFVGPDGLDLCEQVEADEIPDYPSLLWFEEYMMFRYLSDIDRFYREILAVLKAANLAPDSSLQSLLGFQRGCMITPDYDRRIGRTLKLTHDWPSYFERVGSREFTHIEPEPVAFISPATLAVTRTASGSRMQWQLDWHERGPASNKEVLQFWTESVIGLEYRRCRRSYFHELALTVADSPDTQVTSQPRRLAVIQ